MGLDFDKSDAQWSYGGFNRFRKMLAETVGIDLEKMEGFGSPPYKGISWDGIDDEIIPLLNHSDCEGELTAQECKQVAPRLREIASQWEDGAYNHDKVNALILADSMAKCAQDGEPLIFC